MKAISCPGEHPIHVRLCLPGAVDLGERFWREVHSPEAGRKTIVKTGFGLKGYIAHKNIPAVGPYIISMPRDLWWS